MNLNYAEIIQGDLSIIESFTGSRLIELMEYVIDHDNMKVVQYYLDHDLVTSSMATYAIRKASMECIRLMQYKLFQYDVAGAAAGNGRLDILQWLTSLNMTFRRNVINNAIIKGHIHIAKYLTSIGHVLKEDSFSIASRNESKEMLEYLYSVNCPYDDQCCEEACKAGRLKNLQWLREKGFSWNERCITEAINNSTFNINVESIIWAAENDCPIPDNVCNLCASMENLDLLRYFHEIKCYNLDNVNYSDYGFHNEVGEYLHNKRNFDRSTKTCYYCEIKEVEMEELWTTKNETYDNYTQWLHDELKNDLIELIVRHN